MIGIVSGVRNLLGPAVWLLFLLGQEAAALSLEEAVLYSLQTNPEIKEQVENLNSVKAERGMIRSGYFPNVSVAVGTGTAREEITPAYRVTGEDVERTDTSLTASWNLFDGFYTSSEMDANRHRIDSARNFLDEHKGAVTLSVLESYISMMKQKAILQISEEKVMIHREIYNKLNEKVKSGFGSASDLEFASSRLMLAEVNEVVNENNFLQAKVLFETIYGRSVDVETLKEPDFEYTLPKTLEDAALISLDNNPAVRAGHSSVKSAQSGVKRSRSSYYPRIDLELKRSLFEEKDGYDYTVDTTYAMVYLSFNLFNGLADSSAVEREVYTLRQTQAYLDYTKRSISQKLGVSWIASFKIDEQLKRLAELKHYSKKTLDAYYDEFGYGKRTLLDLINVENDYNNARQSYEAARYDLMLSQFRILEAMGGLVEYFRAKADMMKLSPVTDKESPPVVDILKGVDKKLGSRQPLVVPGKTQEDVAKKLEQKKDEDDEMADELKLLQEAIDSAGE